MTERELALFGVERRIAFVDFMLGIQVIDLDKVNAQKWRLLRNRRLLRTVRHRGELIRQIQERNQRVLNEIERS